MKQHGISLDRTRVGRRVLLGLILAGGLAYGAAPALAQARYDGLVNVAQGKYAHQRSTDHGGAATRAVDGNIDGDWSNGSLSHTGLSDWQWWGVWLGGDHAIQSVTIWNRTDCCSDRLRGLRLWLYDEDGVWITSIPIPGGPHPQQRIEVDVGGVVAGRVYVVNDPLPGESSVYLTLAEVQVWAEPEGAYLGCYADDAGDRDLPVSAASSAAMTPELCVQQCADLGHDNAGVQASTECRCGDSAGAHGQLDESACDATCGGSGDMCGGTGRNSIYTTGVEQPLLTPRSAVAGYWHSSGGGSATEPGNPRFTLELDQPGLVEINLTADVDTYMHLLDASGQVVAYNDDVSWPTNSSSRLTENLAAGEYTVVAATFSAQETAHFQVTTTRGELSYPEEVELLLIDEVAWIYWDQGSGAYNDVTIHRPWAYWYPGYYSLGDMPLPYYDASHRSTYIIKDNGTDLLAPPVDYEWVWHDVASGGIYDVSFWRPIPPDGYKCLGHVISSSSMGAGTGYNKPSTNEIRCIKQDYVIPARGEAVWNDAGSGATYDGAVWQIVPEHGWGLSLGTFVGTESYTDPDAPGVPSQYWSLNTSSLAARDAAATRDHFETLGFTWSDDGTLSDMECIWLDNERDGESFNLALASCKIGDDVTFTPLYVECDNPQQCEWGTLRTTYSTVDGNGATHTFTVQGPTLSGCASVTTSSLCVGGGADVGSVGWKVSSGDNSFGLSAGLGKGTSLEAGFENGVLSMEVPLLVLSVSFSLDTLAVAEFLVQEVSAFFKDLGDGIIDFAGTALQTVGGAFVYFGESIVDLVTAPADTFCDWVPICWW